MKTLTVNQILTRVATAVGVGDGSVSDPYSSNEKMFVQMRGLLQDAGDELVKLYDWEILQKEESFTTTTDPSYPFPADFDRMIPGTHWNQASDLPLGGGMSPQDWQYVQNSGIVGTTLYASFRKKEGALFIWPVESGIQVIYEYISRDWVQSSVGVLGDEISAGSDVVLFDSALIRNYLRAKFYEAKGFDTVAPEKVASMFFNSAMATDSSNKILNFGGARREHPLLTGNRNVPDTGYGS